MRSLFKGIAKKSGFMIGLFLAQMLLGDSAFAQSIGFTNPASNDMSIDFLNQIFGGLVNGGTDAFGSSISVFNGAVLTVGGILAAYTILAGTLGTAHDGEMLGKKFSSVYVPIRYALGTALVLPILSGGYCVMQSLVMWVVMQGIALANITWAAYVASPPNILQAKVSPQASSQIETLIQQAFTANVCVYANQKAIAEAPSVLNLSSQTNYGSSNSAQGWLFGDQKNPWTANNCGNVMYPTKPTITTSTAPTGSVAAISGISSVYNNIDTTPIWQVQKDQTDIVVNATATLAKQAVDTPGSVTYAQLQALIPPYISAVQSASASIATSANGSAGVAATATQQGWFLAGSWFTKLINAQNTVTSSVTNISHAEGRISSPVEAISTQANTYIARGRSVLASVDENAATNVENPDGKTDSSASSSSSTTVMGRFGNWISEVTTSIDITDLKTDTRHPLIIMNTIGNRMMTVFVTAFGAASAIMLGLGGLKIAGFGIDLTAWAVLLSTFFIFPLAIFFTTGATLAYVLPNLPFLIWIGIIIGWTIMVVEAVVAAPLWAVMHLHPNGDDLTGRGGNGYMLLLGLLLRPVLIIFGFIAAISLSGLFGEFVNKVFFDVFSSSQLNGAIGFFSMVAGTAVYAAIMYQVLTKTLNLMHVIPDQLMRWIGGGGEQLGQYAGGFSGEGMGKAGAALGAVTGYAAKEGLGHATQMAGQFKQISAGKRGAEEQARGNQIAKEASYSQGENNFGSGHAAVASMIDSQAGKDTLGAAKSKTAFTNASESLGGKNSEAASEYRANVAQSMAEGKSFQEAHSEHYPAAVDNRFGDGAYEAADTLAQSGGAPGSEGYKAQFTHALNTFGSKMNSFQTAGMTSAEAKDTLSGMLNTASAGFKTGEHVPFVRGGKVESSNSFAAHLQQASNQVNADLGISKSSSVPVNGSGPVSNESQTSLNLQPSSEGGSGSSATEDNSGQGDLFDKGDNE